MSIENITLIGVVATFLGTAFTVHYSYKNSKTTKYIETVTTQRINWLEKIRTDCSFVISSLNEFSEISKIRNLNRGYAVKFSDNDFHKENFEQDDEEYFKYKEKMKKFSILEKIHLLKLRLNLEDDIKIINLLLKFEKGVVNTKGYFNTIGQTKESMFDEDMIKFQNDIHLLLKDEWEKVKNEVEHGKKIKDKFKFFWNKSK